MTADSSRSDSSRSDSSRSDSPDANSPVLAGRRPTTQQVAETARFLLYIGVMVVGLSLLVTVELFVRL